MTQETGKSLTLNDWICRALEFANLPHSALSIGPHPDTGEQSWVLDATIQQYSTFLISLSVQSRSDKGMKRIADTVQVENRTSGDTLFWIGDLTKPRITR